MEGVGIFHYIVGAFLLRFGVKFISNKKMSQFDTQMVIPYSGIFFDMKYPFQSYGIRLLGIFLIPLA